MIASRDSIIISSELSNHPVSKVRQSRNEMMRMSVPMGEQSFASTATVGLHECDMTLKLATCRAD